jgi:hypothetical protein
MRGLRQHEFSPRDMQVQLRRLTMHGGFSSRERI